MAYWLIKSEPFKYSWEMFEKDKQTFWDGVRNYAARNNLKAMKKDAKYWLKDENGGMAQLTICNVYQSNGVIHVIDHVVLPK